MDEVVNRFARELADAIGAAIADSPRVEACREKARAAGFEMKLTLEAVVGFAERSQSPGPVKAGTAAKGSREARSRPQLEISASDRRFLRSLRIAVDEATEEVN